jgi:hypothetical protein
MHLSDEFFETYNHHYNHNPPIYFKYQGLVFAVCVCVLSTNVYAADIEGLKIQSNYVYIYRQDEKQRTTAMFKSVGSLMKKIKEGSVRISSPRDHSKIDWS